MKHRKKAVFVVLDDLKKIAVALFCITVLAELAIMAIGSIGGVEAVAKLPVYILEVRSDSMAPRLKNGDCIFGADVPLGEVAVGDVITFYRNGDLITHEVVSVNDNGTVTTKGIQNGYTDGEIDSDEYMGKVIFKMTFLSAFLQLTETVTGKLVFVAAVLVLLFGYPALKALITKLSDMAEKKKSAETEAAEANGLDGPNENNEEN